MNHIKPEIKATDLIGKFGRVIGTYMNKLVFETTKRAAIVCVDEFLENEAERATSTDNYHYWNSVKTELLKLTFEKLQSLS